MTSTHLVRQIELAGRIAFVQERGPDRPNGTTLLLLHTAGQTGVQWRDVHGPLADLGYRVLIPDLPGHGHSEPAADGPVDDLARYADWCVDLLDRLAPDDRVVVVGCSIGGKITQDLACRYSARFAAAVSMCAEPGPGSVKVHALRRELEDSAAPSRSDRTYLGTLAVVGQRVPRQRRELIARMHCREDPQVSNSDLIGWGLHDVRDLFPGVTCPMTFVAGADDLWVDPDAVRRGAEAVPGARYVYLDGYGHYPMEEMTDFPAVLHGWTQDMLGTPIEEVAR